MSETKKFASQADLEEKKITFSQISEHAWAYTAEGDPNTGIVIGDDCVLVADTQATPAMATVWPICCASSASSGVAMCTGLACCRLINPSCKASGPSR